jgi:hypothetical protein
VKWHHRELGLLTRGRDCGILLEKVPGTQVSVEGQRPRDTLPFSPSQRAGLRLNPSPEFRVFRLPCLTEGTGSFVPRRLG